MSGGSKYPEETFTLRTQFPDESIGKIGEQPDFSEWCSKNEHPRGADRTNYRQIWCSLGAVSGLPAAGRFKPPLGDSMIFIVQFLANELITP